MVGLFMLTPSPAGAQVVGSCSGSINGESSSDHASASSALPVDADSTVEVAGSAPGGGGQQYVVELEFLGRRWAVKKGDVSQDGWRGTVKVRDYAGYSVGLFKVIGSTREPSGALTCSNTMYVDVQGRNPLTTVAGAAGAAAMAGGAALVASAGVRARGGMSVPTGSEVGAALLSGRGVVGGALSGVGAAVELQQFAVAFATVGLLLGCVAGGLVVGAVVPMLMAGGSRSGAVSGVPERWAVPAAGVPTWDAPDPASTAGPPLPGSLAVEVVERHGDWVRVTCDNGWSGWTDGRLLEQR